METLPFSPGPIQWTTPATSPAAPPSTTPEPVAKTALEQARGHEKPEKPIEHEPPSVGVATSKPKEPEESVVALATSEPKELEGAKATTLSWGSLGSEAKCGCLGSF